MTRPGPAARRLRPAWARLGLVLAMLALPSLTGCGSSGSGQVVHVLGTWTGSEQDSFLAMVAPFEERTGIKVDYQGSRNSDTILADRVANATPPDLAVLSSPGKLLQYARAGRLVPLDDTLDLPAMTRQYGSSWLELGAVNGKQYAVFVKASLKSLIWYSPKALNAHGLKPPASWDALRASDQVIARSGVSPWCIGLESSSTSGWPGTDWLEDIVLAQSGPDVYSQWATGKLPWNSPQIKRAWQTWGEVIGAPGLVHGDSRGMLLTNFGSAGAPLFGQPPGCYFEHAASFISGYYQQGNSQLKAGQDFDFTSFPSIDPAFNGSEEVAGDLLGMFHSTPGARELIAYLTTPQAQQIWVARGGALSPNREVPLTAYPADSLSRRLGQLLINAKTVRFDASDLMPDAMQSAFYRAALAYANAPAQLDTILTDLERFRTTGYSQ
ncbi:ABC transporter substrate-binding protein [Streptomyces sp. H10-C2]|uniref:ABC transporter substrate-binding protein n=1 Tax=unclassified Streptomyces TaxID=2593676 RepID=UPI0024B971CB|nr:MULTISPECIES: ABC transporter substrate-binding protein [unclassified Streptomyces]MDJ0343503.1 ABC transporter substrate-binding protein [Streptomyces sp. PH10-H1]MDJ0371583.1 ABC transporter substrate-binding protein [Streptomyces sp. H10-C2]